LTGSTTEDTPHLLVRLPEMDEEGIQSRPTENIPFIKPTLISDPVYDGSSEEMRKIEDEKFNKFENEIVEEDVPESTTQLNGITYPQNTYLFNTKDATGVFTCEPIVPYLQT
jgi:hypothetical protein